MKERRNNLEGKHRKQKLYQHATKINFPCSYSNSSMDVNCVKAIDSGSRDYAN